MEVECFYQKPCLHKDKDSTKTPCWNCEHNKNAKDEEEFRIDYPAKIRREGIF